MCARKISPASPLWRCGCARARWRNSPVSSVFFYGPPGTGKTTLAQIIAQYTQCHFEQVNAASIGVKEVRQILEAAKDRLGHSGQRTVLFLDELHRFNRAQQDILLPDVEN